MSLRTQFSRLVDDIKRTRQTLEDQSPNWANVPTLKLASTLKQYAIDNFKAASSIFDRKVDALENLQKQIDELRAQVEGVNHDIGLRKMHLPWLRFGHGSQPMQR